jgi:hypothetical protein
MSRTREVRYLFEHSLRGERGPRLLRYLLERGADEFSITVMALQDTQAPFADRFEDELAPYECGVGMRRVIASDPSSDTTREVRLWAYNEVSLDRLLSFVDSSVLHWPPGPDGWLEDLAVYRDGELLLGLVSHEREGVLRLTLEEHAEVAALGIPSNTSGSSGPT